MLLLRQIDYYLQMLIGILMILSLPVLFLYGFLAGLFLLGCWQLLSAGFNTHSFMINGYRKKIATYWKWTGLVLGVLFLSAFGVRLYNADDMLVLSWAAVAGSIPLAIYYLHIYNTMIAHMKWKKELGGLTKSKH